MPKRRLVLARESLTSLHPDELASVAGAISVPHPLCAATQTTITRYPSCGFGCTANCTSRESC